MHIAGISSLPIQVDASDTTAAVASVALGSMSTLASAIAAVGRDSNSLASFMSVASVAKDSAFALSNAYTSVKSFGQWMQGVQLPRLSNLTSLAHGVNALVLLDKVGGNLVGVSNYTGLAGGMVNASKFVQGLHEGDISKVLFSGARLCAAMALTGNPAATAVIFAAEQVHKRYMEG